RQTEQAPPPAAPIDREQSGPWHPPVLRLRHAVGAAQVASVGDRETQAAQGPPMSVHHSERPLRGRVPGVGVENGGRGGVGAGHGGGSGGPPVSPMWFRLASRGGRGSRRLARDVAGAEARHLSGIPRPPATPRREGVRHSLPDRSAPVAAKPPSRAVVSVLIARPPPSLEVPMVAVTLFVRREAPRCVRARHLLQRRGARLTLVDVTDSPERLAEMIARSGGQRAPPQIFLD